MFEFCKIYKQEFKTMNYYKYLFKDLKNKEYYKETKYIKEIN
jgi:hypothetical protein